MTTVDMSWDHVNSYYCYKVERVKKTKTSLKFEAN